MSYTVPGCSSTREYRVEAHRTASLTSGEPSSEGLWSMSMAEGSRLTGTLAVPDAVEMLLMAVAAALLSGTEEAATLLHLALAAVEVHVYAVMRSGGTCPLTVNYDLTLDSNEPETRLVQLHEELRQASTVLQLIARGTLLNGRMHTRRA